MNWEKAKTVLIVALLITDVFLAGVLYMDRRRVEPQENAAAFHRETKEMLADAGIKVEAEIPKDGETLPVLDVAFETETPEDLNERFFHGKGEIDDRGDDEAVIATARAKLKVLDNRRFIYEADGTSNAFLEKDEAEEKALAFLKERGFATDDMHLYYSETAGNRRRLVFTKTYKKNYVESAYTEVKMIGDRVIYMDRMWIDVLDETREREALPMATQSLLRLLSHKSLKGRTIKKIDPCYYFNPKEQGAVENLSHGTRGYATVAWRMELDGGEELVLLH
ncbi:two-component system regulatory protein YycI [Aedoeadaptatus urinae]|uniref:two-component system regulatory protein YycI n=1 Tax=Aedoeadaptatus urinae TaxID=1871017 RepID=UPI00097D342C|nr:two-component system regulatory protein YycI [Peptoniphilus urinae]